MHYNTNATNVTMFVNETEFSFMIAVRHVSYAYYICGGQNIKTSRCPALVFLRTPIYVKSARVLRYTRGLSAKVVRRRLAKKLDYGS